MSEFSYHRGRGKGFLSMTQNPGIVKEKIDTFGYITQHFCHGRTNKQSKPHRKHDQNANDTVRENVCNIHHT